MLWWELRVGKVVLRDLCSSWGAGGASSAAAAPVAKTLLSGFASGTEGREWACAGDAMGPAARYEMMAVRCAWVGFRGKAFHVGRSYGFGEFLQRRFGSDYPPKVGLGSR